MSRTAFMDARARRGLPSIGWRRLGVRAAAFASIVAVVLALTLLLRDSATSGGRDVAPALAAQVDLAALTNLQSPLEEIERRLARAIPDAESLLTDASPGREARAAQARERVQRLRLELLALGESGSADQRNAIERLNRDLQRLLVELDAVAR